MALENVLIQPSVSYQNITGCIKYFYQNSGHVNLTYTEFLKTEIATLSIITKNRYCPGFEQGHDSRVFVVLTNKFYRFVCHLVLETILGMSV